MTAATAEHGSDARQARAVARLAIIVALLLVWETVARLTAGAFIVAGPSEIALNLWTHAGLIARALAATLAAATLGFLIGNAAAIALACLALFLPRLEPVVAGLALVFFCLPLVATGPILRVVMGPGQGPQVALAALAVYFTTFLPLMVGLRAAPASWFDLVRSYGGGKTTELVQVRAAASVPYLVAGLQIAAPAAFLGAMVGEFTGAERGMGVLTVQAMRALDVPATWTLAVVASATAMAAYSLFGLVGRRLSHAPPSILLAAPAQAGKSRASGLSLGLLTAALVLAIWQAGMDAFGLSPFFAKRPGDVWTFLVTAPDAAENRAILFAAYAETMAHAVPGYLAGLAAGAGLAAAIVVAPALATTVLPVAVALRSIPIVTTAPLIVLALGRGAAGTITIVAVMIFFPTLVACLQGLRQTPAQVLDMFDSYEAGRWSRLRHAQIPAMMPAFFAAARMAVPAAILAATTAEWLATGTGMGALIALTASTSGYGMLWSATVLMAATAALAYLGVQAVERSVLRVFASEQLAR
jgi:ABC-type nitrate/sulfonate/bicarbonate transport system permease component